MRYIIWLLVLIGSPILTSQSKPNQSFDNDGADKVSIYLAWTHQFQFAGYYAAVEKGFYKEQGIDVTLVPGTHSNNVEVILGGEFQYGVGTGGLLITNPRANEITVLAAIMQQSPVTLITLKSNNIQTLTDLEGKSITGGIEIKLMLASANVDLDQVTFAGLTTSFGNLTNGTFDAVSYYVTDYKNDLGSDTLKINSFRPIEYGVNFYGECLFTSREEILSNPERAGKIREATIKGWEYAISNPEEIIEIILEKYPSGLSRQDLQKEAQITIHSLMQPLYYDVGDMQFSKWNQMAESMKSFGIIEEKPDLAGFIYSPPSEIDSGSNQLLKLLLIVVGIGGGLLILLLLYNRQLKRAVAVRTRGLEKTNNELDRFVYSVSHDIKSPLSSIQGIINLMKLDPQGSEKYVQLIESSVHQLNNFTSEILDYSKNSRTEIKIEPVDVNGLIENCIEELKYLDENKKIEFIKEFGTLNIINTDGWRLKIIISNLVSNAIKYHDTRKESSFLKIRTRVGNKMMHIDFEDNGIGIESHHLDKIYDMFYRATSESKGSGLGLYIVNETVNMLNGKIEITSGYKTGTIIKVKIPVASKAK
jgi:signal transduction histidine kinase